MKSEDNYELTRVGAHTPAGRMLRRYWHPVGVSADLKDTPKPRHWVRGSRRASLPVPRLAVFGERRMFAAAL